MLAIERIEHEFTLLKVNSLGKIDIEGEEFLFVGKTDEEISLVCISDKAPEKYIEKSEGWKAFRIKGQLDFSLVGILSKIAGILAENSIPIYAVSTYNTDYVLVRKNAYESALSLLIANGYKVL